MQATLMRGHLESSSLDMGLCVRSCWALSHMAEIILALAELLGDASIRRREDKKAPILFLPTS